MNLRNVLFMVKVTEGTWNTGKKHRADRNSDCCEDGGKNDSKIEYQRCCFICSDGGN